VVVVAGHRQDAEPLAQQAQAYLAEQGLQVRVIVEPERAGHLILRVAEREAADLIIMGAFGATPVRQLILGSTVVDLLRETAQPVLLCR
ncbi:MAG: universal stress protein, partial [Anaerolineales bacterium]|nr:universal stress protein [Anaerolineales bacterium]